MVCSDMVFIMRYNLDRQLEFNNLISWFLSTKSSNLDSKGEKDLIPISEVIAKATRDAISTK